MGDEKKSKDGELIGAIEPQLDLDTVRVLINQARDGDRSAQSELSSHVESYLSVMANRKLDPSLRVNIGVSDIVQQTLMQMIKGIENFRGASTGEFYAWLNRIIESESAKAGRYLKQQKRDVRRHRPLDGKDSHNGLPREHADFSPTPGTHAVSNERIHLFHAALKQLPEDYATVIRLRNLEQLTFPEVAERMDRSVNAVSNLWYRAILKLQQELERIDGNSQQ